MPESSTELTVLDRVQGELVDVRTATTERLAAYIDDLGELRAQLAEGESVVNGELCRRMDFEAAITLRVGDFELKVPGANAGTTKYDPLVLEEVLQALIMADAISESAAARALKRSIAVTFNVPFALDLRDVAGGIDTNVFGYNGHDLEMTAGAISATPVVAGINALRKHPSVAEALDRARERSVAPPRRVVKVAYKGRPS